MTPAYIGVVHKEFAEPVNIVRKAEPSQSRASPQVIELVPV